MIEYRTTSTDQLANIITGGKMSLSVFSLTTYKAHLPNMPHFSCQHRDSINKEVLTSVLVLNGVNMLYMPLDVKTCHYCNRQDLCCLGYNT
jgi:hypothetical protein